MKQKDVLEIVQKIFNEPNCFAELTKSTNWRIGYTNDYPMQHGSGREFVVPNELMIFIYELKGEVYSTNNLNEIQASAIRKRNGIMETLITLVNNCPECGMNLNTRPAHIICGKIVTATVGGTNIESKNCPLGLP